MDKMNIFKLFGLNEEEQKLHILVCTNELDSKQKNLNSNFAEEDIFKHKSKITFIDIQSLDNQLLPKLPFSNQSFDLVVCFNVLFNDTKNSKTKSGDINNGEIKNGIKDSSKSSLMNQQAILEELCRVGSEIRILPVMDDKGKPFGNLGPVLQTLQEKGIGAELKQTNNENGNLKIQLRIWNSACDVV